MKKTFSWILLSVICVSLCLASGPGDEEPVEELPSTENDSGWVYGFLEYPHDVAAPNVLFMKLLEHPGGKVPLITGGFASTDVDVFVKISGIDAPRAMHHAADRHRPHVWRDRERENWDKAMRYVWNLSDPTHTFRLHNLKVIDTDPYLQRLTGENKILEGDLEFYLGGAWHNLAISMLNDEHARPLQSDSSTWDPGSKEYSLENPNNPR